MSILKVSRMGHPVLRRAADPVADPKAPFGGAKQSGNGREWGVFGIEEYLEVKSIMGWNGAA